MADYKSFGTINYWTRSTDLRSLGQCPMSWLLGRLYEPTRGKGYFHFGTGIHYGVECAIKGATMDEATMEAIKLTNELIKADEDAGKPIDWTKKRPEDGWQVLAAVLISQWWTDVMRPDGEVMKGMPTQMPFYRDREPIELEYTTDTAPEMGVTTEIDSIWERKVGVPGYDIVDWKTGSTAKSDSLQLWLYNYAARHTPGSPLVGVGPEAIGMYFHHIAFSKLQEAEAYPGDDYIDALLYYSREQRHIIHEGGFAPCNTDWYCNYCQSQPICPIMGQGDLHTIAEAAKVAPAELARPE